MIGTSYLNSHTGPYNAGCNHPFPEDNAQIPEQNYLFLEHHASFPEDKPIFLEKNVLILEYMPLLRTKQKNTMTNYRHRIGRKSLYSKY